jgi:hypothetical protein
LLWLLLVLLLEDGDVDDGDVVVLGYVERSGGAAGDGLVCATTIPAAISAATAKDAATRFIGSSDRFARTQSMDRCARGKNPAQALCRRRRQLTSSVGERAVAVRLFVS